ncbi:MAG: RluA family pseudouridine synthase [Enterococcus sp.]
MEFTYQYQKEVPQQVKAFLKEQGVSKGLLAKIKFQGGKIMVNQQVENVLYVLTAGDLVTITIPDEQEYETMLRDETPLAIVYEDEHLLVVNKPAGVASIPAQYHPNQTMANRVKAYYMRNDYPNKVVHIVTRLDRDTSGLMLFAKHGFAHAKLDVQLREKQFVKKYQALVGGEIEQLQVHGQIKLPIARDLTSILKRQVAENGQNAYTEYWLKARKSDFAIVDIQLHTGRTHQIRVHFAGIGCPLLGDEMYEGQLTRIKRQALHCYLLQFNHPFTGEKLIFQQPLPADMQVLSNE